MSQSDIDDLTMKLLSVPSNKMTAASQTSNPVPREDQLFYKKRILRLMKGMLEGTIECSQLQAIHTLYVREVTEYLKIKDVNDSLQAKYQGMLVSTATKPPMRPFRDIPVLAGKKGTLTKLVRVSSKKKEVYPHVASPRIKTEANRIKTDNYKT